MHRFCVKIYALSKFNQNLRVFRYLFNKKSINFNKIAAITKYRRTRSIKIELKIIILRLVKTSSTPLFI